jgi:hypothetical protein
MESRFGPFGDTVSVVQDRSTVCAKCTTGSEIILDTSYDTLGDEAQVESRFGPFGDSVSVSARKVHGLHQTNHRLRNHFGRTQWYS